MPEDGTSPSCVAPTATVEERLERIEAALGRLMAAWEHFEPLVKEWTSGPVRTWAAARRMRHG